MRAPRRHVGAARVGLLTGAAVLCLAAACTERQGDAPARAAPADGGWRSFQGTWSAAGDRHALEVAPGAQASVLDLSGSILLTGEGGIGAGFQARFIGYTDGASSIGRAVWTDDRGDRIFSELRGAPVAAGQRIAGRFTGGTGRWAGITGEYGFAWRYVVDTEGRLQGRAEGLTGRARIAPPGGTP